MIPLAWMPIVWIACFQSVPRLEPPPAPDFKTRVDYMAWIEKSVVAGLPADQNAAPLYRDILGEMKDGDVASSLGFSGFRTDADSGHAVGPWDPSDHRDWERANRRTGGVLDAYRKAATKPYAYFPVRFDEALPADQRTLLHAWMPWMRGFRALAKGASEAAWRAEDGKVDAADFLEAMQCNLRAARQLERYPLMLSQLVGLSIRSMTYDDLAAALHHEVWDAKGRESAAAMLRGDDADLQPFRRSLYCELAAVYDVAQMLAAGSGGAFRVDDRSGLIAPGGGLMCDPATARDAAREHYEAFAKECEAPYSPQRVKTIETLVAAAGKRDPLLANMLPGLDRAYLIRTRCEATRRATRILYEIHAFRDKNKKWPARLENLPAATAPLRIDPFSGKPFVYRVTGDGFVLYSVAQNGQDDGAAHDPKWGDAGAASDFVFWPRP